MPLAIIGAGAGHATPAAAQQTVIMGSVGSSSANSWATYIAIEKGFFAGRRHQARHGARAVQCLGDPAARRRLAST